MLFHTWVFLAFFLIVYPVYLLVRRNNQLMNIWLMIASYTFYGWWNPWYLLLLFGTSAIDYFMVLLMERGPRVRHVLARRQPGQQFWLPRLFQVFRIHHGKHQFVSGHFGLSARLPNPVTYPDALLSLVGVPEDWLFTKVILPIGISFHTFQSMSYTIDAYRGVIQTEVQFCAVPDVCVVLPSIGGRPD